MRFLLGLTREAEEMIECFVREHLDYSVGREKYARNQASVEALDSLFMIHLLDNFLSQLSALYTLVLASISNQREI